MIRLPRIPDLNASRLPWLQAALAKGFMAHQHNASARKQQKWLG